LGSSTESTASAQFIANFWGYDGAQFLGTPPRLYNQIALQIARDQGMDQADELARYLAVVNTAMADAGVGSWDTKYFYDFARPVTGIRRGNDDGNPSSIGDPAWEPFGASVINGHAERFTPPFPAYVSGHATFGAAMFEVVRSYYGDATPFTFVSDEYNGTGNDPGKVFGRNEANSRPYVPVRYVTLRQAQEENGISRIYNGVHWSWDNVQGQMMGEKIARYTLDNAFQRMR
jgi:hypothetical protein